MKERGNPVFIFRFYLVRGGKLCLCGWGLSCANALINVYLVLEMVSNQKTCTQILLCV